MFKKLSFFIVFLLAVGVFKTTVYAQEIDISQFFSPQASVTNQDQYVTISVTPENPGPYEKIQAFINSYSINLNNSYITWTLNGNEIQSGAGVKNVEVAVGGIGNTYSLRAIIQTESGAIVEREVTIQPADVDLVWESQSYTPPFYKGKALYGPQGEVVITALPQVIEFGSRVSSSNLIFKWKKNGEVLGNLSGLGKNTLSFTGSIITSPVTITVEVTSPNSVIKAVKKMVIRPSTPKVLLYENNPLYGIRFNNAITKEFSMSDSELTLIATPYFFSTSAQAGEILAHTWRLNNKKIEEGSNKNIITFRRPEEAGISQVSLGIESHNKVLQSARSTILIKFEKAKNESI